MSYSVEKVTKIYNEAGDWVEVGEDREGMGMVEVRNIGRNLKGERLVTAVAMPQEQAVLVAQAMLVAAHLIVKMPLMNSQTTKVARIWNDTTSEYIEVGEDHDALGLLELRSVCDDGKIGQSVNMSTEQGVCAAQALLALEE